MKNIYFDNAATTKMRQEVIDVMVNTMRDNYGNASSSHSFGRSAKSLIVQARKNIAKHFNIAASEIIFTSGGTEADNFALRSAVRDCGVTEIITSKIEHHAVLHTIEQLQKEYNIIIQFVNIDKQGSLDYLHLESLLQSKAKKLVSIMHVNNEIGNLLDIKKVADLCKEYKTLFHCDSVQSVGHYKIDLQDIPVDFMAASAHKFHGPKGVGFAFIRKNSGIKPLIFGGEQERGYRAGTESIHNIIGLEYALKMAYDNLEEEQNYIETIKAYFIKKLQDTFPNVSFNGNSGSLAKSTYTLINVCLPITKEKASMLLFQLDLKGIACSKGSACQSGSAKDSHVLAELLNDEDLQKPSIRFSFSTYNTKDEVDYVISVLEEFKD
jgi:cysteine desulfurase